MTKENVTFIEGDLTDECLDVMTNLNCAHYSKICINENGYLVLITQFITNP